MNIQDRCRRPRRLWNCPERRRSLVLDSLSAIPCTVYPLEPWRVLSSGSGRLMIVGAPPFLHDSLELDWWQAAGRAVAAARVVEVADPGRDADATLGA